MESSGAKRAVVHVRGDSGAELDDLFRTVLNASESQDKVPLQVPWRKRNMPASFFQEPKIIHSRESSADSTNYGGNLDLASRIPLGPPPPHQLSVAHGRAHSSPASLQEMRSINPQDVIRNHHLRQQSYDISDDQLPAGWEMAVTPTGQRYFLDHNRQATTWEDPRKTAIANNQLNKPNTNTNNNQVQQIIMQGSSSQPLPSMQDLGPLPSNWEQAATPEGEVYFINHIDRSTTWLDPRIAMRAPGTVQAATAALQSQNNSIASPSAGSATSPPQAPPPPPPSLPPLSPPPGPNPNHQPGALTPQQLQQKLRLQRVLMERECLQRQQMRILQQAQQNPKNLSSCPNLFPRSERWRDELALRRELAQNSASNNNNDSGISGGSDPFLTGNTSGGTTNFHRREESGDSGCGLSNVSHPRTPDDLLNTLEDMDSSDVTTERKPVGKIAPVLPPLATMGDFLESLPSTNVDMATMDPSESSTNVTSMDSDDLVPSLPEGLGPDILSDVAGVDDVNNFLTWL